MKKTNYGNECSKEISAINEKCDLIVELLESVLDNPDFLIDRLRMSVEHQHRSACRPRMKIVRYDETR